MRPILEAGPVAPDHTVGLRVVPGIVARIGVRVEEADPETASVLTYEGKKRTAKQDKSHM